jgi:GDP-L-fucose synthase
MNKKILITGGTSHLAESLKKYLPNASYIEGRSELDLTDYQSTLEYFKNESPYWVLHLAAKVGGIKSNMENPFEYFYDNLLINTNVFRACKELGIERLTSILSTCVYPADNVEYPITEDNIILGDPEKTNRGYAQSKRILAELTDLYNHKYRKNYNYIIPCNLFGMEESYDPNKTHFLTSLIYKSAKALSNGNKELEMFGSGKVLRQFVTYDDFARMLAYCVDNEVTESFNFSPDYNLSLIEYGSIIENIADKKIKVTFNGNGPDGVYRKDADNSRMKKIAPDFEFSVLGESIKEVLDFYLANDSI